MKLIKQIKKNFKIFEFDPNKYYNGESLEEKIFLIFLRKYGWEEYKNYAYNRGQHHIYVIFDYTPGTPVWVGFLHALECDDISKKLIQQIYFLEEALFDNKVVFIHTISIRFRYRHKRYATSLVNIVKQEFSEKADIMVEAVKKGKKFWPAVGFIRVQKTPKGEFMLLEK